MCREDNFAATLDEMMLEIADGIGDGLRPVAERAGDTGRDKCRELANQEFTKSDKGEGKGQGTGKYARGFRRKVKGARTEVSVEIGNAKYPGLVHLLEKGHATLGGGHVPGRPHVSEAAKIAMEQFGDEVDELVDRVLGG